MSDATLAPEGLTAGAMLRQAREACGLHVAALAVNLKVPVRKLEALEADRYEELPDAVFVRALASSVCRTLKIDVQPVLDRLPQTARPRLVPDSDGINTPFRGPSDGPKPGLLDQLSRPVMLTVVALLLGAVVMIFLPVAQRADLLLAPAPKADPVMPPGTPATINAAPAEPRAPDAAPPPTPSTAPQATTPVALKPASAPPAAPGVASPAIGKPAPAPAARAASAPAAALPAAPAVAATAPPPPSAPGIVTFRTRGTSWVQVTDAKGASVLRRLMEPGETAGATGALPLTVTIGSVEATEVQVRGKPVDLAPHARDNVARFEVK